MSITNEKLQTIKDNVSKVYRSGQMDVIKNANSLKGFESSKAMLLDDVSPLEHEMEVRVHGKNLFDVSQVESTTGLTNNGNGTLTVTEFAVSTTLLKTICPALKVGETYFLTFTTTGVPQIYLNGANIPWYPGKSLTITETMLNSKVLFYCKRVDGVNAEAVITDIQIELGTTATKYEPYNTDIQNVHSKNLIPYPYRDLKLGTSTYNGVDFTVYEDGSVLINGTATSNTTRYLYNNKTDLLGLKSGITISCSKNASDDTQQGNIYLVCNYYDSTGTMQPGAYASTTSSGKKTITDDWKGLGIYLHIPSGKTLDNLLIKPQLEIGSTATYYEKYHEPYPLVIKELGKNLFNINAHTSNNCYKDGIFSGTNKSSSKEYIYMNITDIWKIVYNSKLPITCSFDMKTEIDGEISVYTLGEYHMTFNSGAQLKLNSTTDWQHFDITFTKTSFTTRTQEDYCHLSFYGIYDSGIIPSVKNLQIYLGDTIISEYEDYIVPAEYTPTTDGVINGVKNLYPNTTLVSNGDRVYIDCNYYKDVDKAYNKLSAKIALSGGE